MFRKILFILYLFSACVAAEKKDTRPTKQTICLNMIVKNESEVIRRCLDSVKSLIDYWVIVDTGSTDGTQTIIREHLKAIPGELYERPWRNFGENRTEAFELAKKKGTYILFMDADDTLEFTGKKEFPHLAADQYNMWRGIEGFTYTKPQLVKGDLPWKWVGVTHEYLDCDKPYSYAILENVKYISGDDGASSKDTAKFLKNIKLLEDGLKKDPLNARYAFYLAESYYDANEKAKALEWYQKRVNMGGWEEEVFWSMLRIGLILQELGLPSNVVAECYQNAHHYRPHRAEPVYYLADLYNQQGEYAKAYKCLKEKEKIAKAKQKDILFNIDWIENYGLLSQLSICSYYIGKDQESLDACERLLKIKELPEDWRKLTEKNRTYPLNRIKNASLISSSSH